jgi:hypothetical protein
LSTIVIAAFLEHAASADPPGTRHDEIDNEIAVHFTILLDEIVLMMRSSRVSMKERAEHRSCQAEQGAFVGDAHFQPRARTGGCAHALAEASRSGWPPPEESNVVRARFGARQP